MDVQMPGLGGVEVVRRLLHAHPDANVVMLTVASDREAVAAAIAGGARGFLHKDVSREELSATVANVLTISALPGDARPAPIVRTFDPNAPILTERTAPFIAFCTDDRNPLDIAEEGHLDFIIRKAIRLLDSEKVDFEYDGEMQADMALDFELLKSTYPFARLTGPANVLVMPGLHSAHISSRLMQKLGGVTVIGPVIDGLEKPVQIVQMGATVSDLVNHAALAAYGALSRRR